MKDTKKHGHPGNQFNRQAPEGKEGFNFGVSITWRERAALEQKLVTQGIKPTKEEIAKLARTIMKQGIAKHHRDLVSLDRFAAMHNVAPLDVTRAINMQVLRADEVTQDDGTIVLMLDSEGRRAFWEALHDAGTWTDCPICPHDLY